MITNINRYKPDNDGRLWPASDGEYVLYADHVAALALIPGEPVGYRYKLRHDTRWEFTRHERTDVVVCEPVFAAPPPRAVAHIDPDLEPGEYIVTIATKGGAAEINGPVKPAPQPVAVKPLELLDPADDEAIAWVSQNLCAIRRDDGSLHYGLTAVVRAFQAGRCALTAEVETGKAAEIVMGRGLVDVTTISYQGRTGILFRPRSEHIPVGADGQLQEGEYWPVAGDVVIWIENEAGAQVIDKFLRPFLTSPSTSASEGKLTEAQLQAEAALHKVMNFRFSNFDAGAVIHWAERGMYQLKAPAPFSPTPAPDIAALREENERLRAIALDIQSQYIKQDAAIKVLKRIEHWAQSRCPCHEETPNPCPLCGASVENLEACKAVENIFPRDLLADLRSSLQHEAKGERG